MNGIIFGTRCHDDLPRSYAISQMSLTSFFQRKRKSLKPQIGKRPMIMVAPDKFKGTLTAGEVTALISDALVEAFPGAGILRCPMADGGEGTAEIIARNLGLSPATTTGHDAMMHDIEIGFFKNGDTCAVDAAAIVGLAMLAPPPLRPWEASTYGLGEFILEMLRQGFKRIIICIGGTATVDAGVGMLQALGARFLDVEGNQISVRPITAANLSSIYSIDFSGIDRNPIKEAVTALADVDVPLLPSCEGEMSALDFAPQKGIQVKELPMLRASLENFRNAIDNALYTPSVQPPFQGAGGGLGYALHRILRCRCIKGSDNIIDSYDILHAAPTNADETAYDTSVTASPLPNCIITGEGCFDAQSLHGKITGAIIERASALSIPVIVVAGISRIDNAALPENVTILTTSAGNQPYIDSINRPGALITHAAALDSLCSILPTVVQAVAEASPICKINSKSYS